MPHPYEESGCAENEESRCAALLFLESEVGPLKSNPADVADVGGRCRMTLSEAIKLAAAFAVAAVGLFFLASGFQTTGIDFSRRREN